MLSCEPLQPWHAEFVGERLRAEDRAEVQLMGIRGPDAALDSLRQSVAASTILVQGTPAAVLGLGVVDVVGGIGCPWLLTTAEVERCRVGFARAMRELVAQALAITPRLENLVDARYARAIALARWIGFTVDAPRGGFCRFWMEN